MNYAGIIKNDFAAAPGTCVSFFTQGCPHHCYNCQNKETWDFLGGKEFTSDTISDIIQALQANEVHRDFCVMGGEPMCPENQLLTLLVIQSVKEALPDTKIYLWTGYTIETLKSSSMYTSRVQSILELCDYIVDGPYLDEERDITLFMRGSRNQRILAREDFI